MHHGDIDDLTQPTPPRTIDHPQLALRAQPPLSP